MLAKQPILSPEVARHRHARAHGVAILYRFPTAFTLMALASRRILGSVSSYRSGRSADILRDAERRPRLYPAVPVHGYLVERAGIVDKLFKSVQLLMGACRVRWPSRLAPGALFATATGIVGASVTLLGLLALPAMIRRGYNVSFGSGVIVAAGTLGILIPPSVLLILYGFIAGVSVPRLYAAAFIPGLLLVGFYLVYIIFRAWRNPLIAPALPIEERTVPLGLIIKMLITGLLPILTLILFVLGAIFFGIATRRRLRRSDPSVDSCSLWAEADAVDAEGVRLPDLRASAMVDGCSSLFDLRGRVRAPLRRRRRREFLQILGANHHS